ncbi:hypothetical protein [Paractinoplanes deccanensis]|nr:hypothetical protein [Actinoplanes deccanensis]
MAAEPQEIFDAAKAQAQVVGSGLMSFAQGVTPEVREAISNSALLAQLVANKRASAEKDPIAWYSAYTQVLQNVGWVLQESGWADYTAKGQAAEVHEKIIEVLSVALGPSVAALKLLQSAIDVLKAMKPDTSWLTIFSRETEHASIARFQIGLVEPGENDDVFVSMLACLVEGSSSVTQVLFFKYRAEHARFKGNSAKVSLNRAALEDLGPEIRKKVRAYMTDYLSTITDI